jgi:hypothetical protein
VKSGEQTVARSGSAGVQLGRAGKGEPDRGNVSGEDVSATSLSRSYTERSSIGNIA